jgi:hypothetical protein
MKPLTRAAALAAVALAATPADAFAYIDPGSTSLLLQGIIGGIAAFLVMTRSWWQRLLGRARGRGAGNQDRPVT